MPIPVISFYQAYDPLGIDKKIQRPWRNGFGQKWWHILASKGMCMHIDNILIWHVDGGFLVLSSAFIVGEVPQFKYFFVKILKYSLNFKIYVLTEVKK